MYPVHFQVNETEKDEATKGYEFVTQTEPLYIFPTEVYFSVGSTTLILTTDRESKHGRELIEIPVANVEEMATRLGKRKFKAKVKNLASETFRDKWGNLFRFVEK